MITDRPVGSSVFFPAYNDGGTIVSLVIARFSPTAAPARR
jgi:hypothetical protein